MSRKTIKRFEEHVRKHGHLLQSQREQGVTFRDARKPGLGPSTEREREPSDAQLCAMGMSRAEFERRILDPNEFTPRTAPTLPPPPASVEVACLLARAQELEDTARMMLARAAELREVAERADIMRRPG